MLFVGCLHLFEATPADGPSAEAVPGNHTYQQGVLLASIPVKCLHSNCAALFGYERMKGSDQTHPRLSTGWDWKLLTRERAGAATTVASAACNRPQLQLRGCPASVVLVSAGTVAQQLWQWWLLLNRLSVQEYWTSAPLRKLQESARLV